MSESEFPDFDDESTFPNFPTPAVKAQWNAIFRSLLTEFDASFLPEDSPEDGPDLVAHFLFDYFDGVEERIEDLIDRLEERLEDGSRN